MKSQTFRLITALLAFLFLLTGCSQQQAAEPESTKPVSTEAMPAEPVTDAYRGEWTATTGETYTYAIPKIDLPGEYTEKVNDKIFALYREKLSDEGELRLAADYSYESYVCGDLLSVVLRIAYPEQLTQGEDFSVASQHYVYTLHLSDGSEATPEEVLTLAGVAPEEFYEHVSAALGNAFCLSLSEDLLQDCLSDDTPTSPEAVLPWFSDTISVDNAKAALPYLNENGELFFVGTVYQIAGAVSHTRLLPYAREEEISPYYEALLELTQ